MKALDELCDRIDGFIASNQAYYEESRNTINIMNMDTEMDKIQKLESEQDICRGRIEAFRRCRQLIQEL